MVLYGSFCCDGVRLCLYCLCLMRLCVSFCEILCDVVVSVCVCVCVCVGVFL